MLNITYKGAVIFSAILAILFSLYIGKSAIDHNPTEIYCKFIDQTECHIVWKNLLPLFLTWFMVVFTPLFVILFITRAIYRKLINK